MPITINTTSPSDNTDALGSWAREVYGDLVETKDLVNNLESRVGVLETVRRSFYYMSDDTGALLESEASYLGFPGINLSELASQQVGGGLPINNKAIVMPFNGFLEIEHQIQIGYVNWPAGQTSLGIQTIVDHKNAAGDTSISYHYLANSEVQSPSSPLIVAGSVKLYVAANEIVKIALSPYYGGDVGTYKVIGSGDTQRTSWLSLTARKL